MRSNLPPDQLARILAQTNVPVGDPAQPVPPEPPRGIMGSFVAHTDGGVRLVDIDLPLWRWMVVMLKVGFAAWLVALLLALPSYLLWAMFFAAQAVR